MRRKALPFEDTEGLRMILLDNRGEEVPHDWAIWDDSIVPKEHQILGMGPIEITVKNLNKLAKTLTEMFGFVEISRSEGEAIYQSIEGHAFGEILVKQLDGPSEKPGRGSIHHLAIRVKNGEELQYWANQVQERGFFSSKIIDRYFFKSLYFRESNGILFEIATDGPGFTVDESVESLGVKLDLPPFLEDKRATIEANLEPID